MKPNGHSEVGHMESIGQGGVGQREPTRHRQGEHMEPARNMMVVDTQGSPYTGRVSDMDRVDTQDPPGMDWADT